MIDKATSEKHFIRVVYDYLLASCPAWLPPSMENKELAARSALELHKDYWERCCKDDKPEVIRIIVGSA